MTTLNDIQWGNTELPGLSDDKLLNTNWNHVTAIKQRSLDPNWHSNNQKAIDIKKQKPAYQIKRSKLNKAMAKDRTIQDKKSQTIKQQYADSNYKEFRTLIIQEVTKTDEWKQSHNLGMTKREENGWHEKNLMAAQKRCKPIVSVEYGIFLGKKHLVEYMKSVGVGNAGGKLDNWLKTKPTEFYYITKEEYIMLTGKDVI
jgi:hypothetical protein